MVQFLLFLTLSFALGFLPPFRWGARLAGAVMVLLAIAFVTEPTPYHPDWGYDLLRAGVIWLTGALLVAIDYGRGLQRWSFRGCGFVAAPMEDYAPPLCTLTTLPLLPD